MNKYKLKDGVKKYYSFSERMLNDTASLTDWIEAGVSEEALEEVPQRVELFREHQGTCAPTTVVLIKAGCEDITEQERLLCEQALNGELFTKEQMFEFFTYYENQTSWSSYEYALIDWLKTRKG